MNAKTEKRLGLTAAFLLTAAIFVAPNTMQQASILHHFASEAVMMPQTQRSEAAPLLLSQNFAVTADTQANHLTLVQSTADRSLF